MEMGRLSIVGDGNCCFCAVAYSLNMNHKSICESLPTFFSSIGIANAEHSSQTALAQKLREIALQEWQNNYEEYEGFLFTSNVMQES